ncbi:response regulator transcription factor [Roseivirga sp. E12]|uniref:response regulator transcription factor n=1 Tax=Roseivirga sp. E12 TaxID=2819237 RepID=UPI001ABC56FE|nr:response regulator transcription factor [Roseivirga sp. E12]MBO3698055.1 response regulator transcription factor [Roseivirga sp. E12]
MNRILLVEDDDSFGYILKEYLEINDFNVDWVQNGELGLDAFLRGVYDLCILDIMMPLKDGFTLAKEIQEHDSSVPFIFLTAKSLKIDKLKGFRLGCDDFVVKPIDEEIFIARVKALMKRTGIETLSNSEGSSYEIGLYIFDSTNQALSYGEVTQRLTTKEAKLLQLLCDKKNQVLDRNLALKAVWGESDFFNRKSMDVFIHKLRKYLEQDPTVKITNVHGKGFVLEA